MIVTSLVALLLTVGPVLDPITGGQVTARERELLPTGRHLGEVADLWFVEIVSMQNGDGGMALFDPLYLSSHGRSWTQNRFTLNGLSIDDPARTGLPLFEVPYYAWSQLTYRSLWSGQPGFDASIDHAAGDRAFVRLSGGAELGGGTWVPEGFMNREPALRFGAPRDRRGLREAREAAAEVSLGSGDEALRLFVDHVEHRHDYPTLRDSTSGEKLDDEARRSTLLALGRVRFGAQPYDLTFGWQERGRSHEGAEFRHPVEYTENTASQALLGHVAAELACDCGARLRLAAGVAHRDDRERQNGDAPLVSDLEREWTWLSRLSPAGRTQRTSIDGAAALTGPAGHPFEMRLTVSQAHVTHRSPVDGFASTWERAPLDESVALTVLDPTRRNEDWQRAARLETELERDVDGFAVRALLAIDYGAVGVPGETRLSFVTPAVGVAVRKPLGDAEAFVLLRREPDRLGAQVSTFLDPARGNGRRYAWNDDGDGLPESGEAGALLARTGGAYHVVDDDLVRPTSNQLGLGWRSPRFGPFRAVLTGVLRFHLDALTVRYTGPAAESFRAVPFHDPGGDGRGEVRAPGGGQDLTAYERVPGSEGAELYALTNRSRDNRFIGAELQLLSVEEARWFLNLGAAGYWNIGSGAFGSFPDRNDPGIVDESTADPNARISARGRFDQDRAFAVKLMTGWEPLDDLVGTVSIRYRDGQPFTRIAVAELAQGPTPIMTVWRGAPRHTFHMVVDTRLRYTRRFGELRASLLADVYNLLGSGTEILEDPRTGRTFRDALEMVPGRAGLLGLEVEL